MGRFLIWDLRMEIAGNELLKMAKELLDKGENLDLAASYFNRLYNETLNGHGKPEIFLFYLAAVAMKQNHDAMSILLFKEVLRLDPYFIEAYNNLGYMYKRVAMFDEAKQCFEKVQEILPTQGSNIPDQDKSEYLTNLGSLMIANGTPKLALEYFDKASMIVKDVPYNLWNSSLAYLELGDYEKGFSLYDFGDRNAKSAVRKYNRKELPDWDGTPGKTIVVFGEQGIGDEIMFASMLPDAMKDCRVILDSHPRLADLFRLNFPMIPVYGTRKDTSENVMWAYHHNIDAKIAIGSLAKYYRKKEQDFPRVPYLIPDPVLVEKYSQRLAAISDKPKIGFSWMGGVKSTGRNERHIPLELWVDLFNQFKDQVDFISLQYNKDISDKVKEFELKHSFTLNHWPDVMEDYDETAGLVANLDLIISAPQSVVHLAASMGTPVWQLTPFKAMWQMGPYGQEMPWYACTRNFWQDPSCRWEPIMDSVREELCNLLAKTIEN